MLARNQFWQIFPLLRFVAVAADLVDAEIRMRAVGETHRRRRPGNLLHRDAVFEKACTVSRIASAVSPRSKLNIRCALGIMIGLPPAICADCLAHSLIRCK